MISVLKQNLFNGLKDGGFTQIKVPDIYEVMKIVIEKRMDIEDVLYQSSAGPIMVLDVLYGYSVEIERSGKDFYAHKTGFTHKSLVKAIVTSGFSEVFTTSSNLEINVIAFKGAPNPVSKKMFGII